MSTPPKSSAENPPELGMVEELILFKDWCLANRSQALLLLTILASLAGFFGLAKLFVNGSMSLAQWAGQAWVGDQSHSWLVPPVSLYLLWYHKEAIRRAPKAGSNRGLIYVVIGVLLFVLSVRCLQPRMALFSIPVLVYGATYFLWGANVARIILFPCGFLIFMIPFGVVEQATFKLQFVITGLVGFITNFLGIKITALGTTLAAADGSFNFEIAGGCVLAMGVLALIAAAQSATTRSARVGRGTSRERGPR